MAEELELYPYIDIMEIPDEVLAQWADESFEEEEYFRNLEELQYREMVEDCYNEFYQNEI